MPHDQRTMYFRLSIIINIVFVLGALFVMMKYQVIFASKLSFTFTFPNTTIFRPVETAQIQGQQLDTQFKPIIASYFENAKDKTEIIVSFLALLELTKQRIIIVRQKSIFKEIIIEKV